MPGWDTVYVIGEARINMDNAITIIYNSFYMGFEVDLGSDEIIDLGCTHTMEITERFIKSIFMGKQLREYDPNLEEEIKMRYHGTSQKAVIVCYKDALKKYMEIRQKYYS